MGWFSRGRFSNKYARPCATWIRRTSDHTWPRFGEKYVPFTPLKPFSYTELLFASVRHIPLILLRLKRIRSKIGEMRGDILISSPHLHPHLVYARIIALFTSALLWSREKHVFFTPPPVKPFFALNSAKWKGTYWLVQLVQRVIQCLKTALRSWNYYVFPIRKKLRENEGYKWSLSLLWLHSLDLPRRLP